MDGELVLWGILPVGVALALAAVSLYSLCRDFRSVQFLLAAPVMLLTGGAVWVLASMLRGGWPTFLPHLAIVLVLPLAAAQVCLFLRRKRT